LGHVVDKDGIEFTEIVCVLNYCEEKSKDKQKESRPPTRTGTTTARSSVTAVPIAVLLRHLQGRKLRGGGREERDF
jgi:hypothetical protein